MLKHVAEIFALILAAICLVGFAGIYGYELYKGAKLFKKPGGLDRTQATAGDPNDIKDPYSYVVTILTGLVGAVVAIFFGEPASRSAILPMSDWKSGLLVAYGVIYLVVGIAGVVEWIFPQRFCPSILVKTLALTFLGLVAPVVTTFFQST